MVKETFENANCTIYVPENPKNIAIYFHAMTDFPHAKGRISKTLYNFQEDVVEGIFNRNPDTIVVAARYYKKIVTLILAYMERFGIQNAVVSGWSLGGNDAISFIREARKITPFIFKLFLIDSNHTNQFDDKVLKDIKGVPITYLTNTLTRKKTTYISKIIKNEFELKYLLLSIPKGFDGSNHRFCRDSAINDNIYGYILDLCDLPNNYKVGHWDPDKGEIVV